MSTSRTLNRALWTVQVLLALLYIWSGTTKLTLPAAAMQAPGPVHFPTLFYRFIAICELLGAVGLILPSLLRIRPVLTPLAASCLFIIMIGATTVTFMLGMYNAVSLPIIAGVLDAFVAYGRFRLAPISAAVQSEGQLLAASR
jgi:uncharacterized membrane protein YphA (DoxX/SURF4 family)